jgi:LemA protein
VAGIIGLIVVVALLAVLGLWVIGIYNGLVRLRNLVQESWRQIDVELTRRHDLIPNLVETVRGYATHERDALDSVVAARSSAVAAGSTVPEQAVAEGTLSSSLGRLFAVAEAYPQLKANQNFLALQTELTETEDRVAAGRRFYNANVRELNTRVESFPSNLFARTFGIRQAEYFEVVDSAARLAPVVRLDPPGSPAAGSPSTAEYPPVTPGEYGEYGEPGQARQRP